MSDHIGDANKMISETPRTDAKRGFHGLDTAVDAEFSKELELELNAAHERIKRLEEAGDELCKWTTNKNAAKQWSKAKEAKP